MTKADPNVHVPTKLTPVMTVVVPGRRALGETYTKIEIGHANDRIVAHASPAETPASGQPLMIMHGADEKYADYLLEAMTEKQRAEFAVGSLSWREKEQIKAEAWERLQRDWFDHMENKVRHLKGVTQIGAGGMHQRQKVHQNPATRPKRG